VRLRLQGTPEEVEQILGRLIEVFTVVAISPAYPDRPPSRLIRIYVEVRL
jgi:hypothetical protein